MAREGIAELFAVLRACSNRAMRWISGSVIGLALSAHATAARAGNEESVLFGAAAEMSAGAVAATTRDGAALWYNPAGLASADDQQVDVSGTAYVFRRYSSPDLIQVRGGAGFSAEVIELMSVSAAVTYVRRISDRLSLGFGVFTPRSSDETLRVNAAIPGDVRWQVAAGEVASEVNAGVGLGWAVNPRLSLGASLFVTYESYYGSALAQVTRGAGIIPEEFANFSTLYSHKRAGVELSFGAQWLPVDWLRVGVNIRPPGVHVFASETVDATASSATRDAQGALQAGGESLTTSGSGTEFTQRTPLRVRFGVALMQPRFTLSVDGDVSTEFMPDDPDDRRWSTHWNLRLGGVVRLAERLRVGAGFFTDRAPDRSAAGQPVDFYGGTLGIEWGTLHMLRAERRDRLRFSTSLSLRYAYGSGNTNGFEVISGSIESEERRASIEVHELAVYLGSSFRF